MRKSFVKEMTLSRGIVSPVESSNSQDITRENRKQCSQFYPHVLSVFNESIRIICYGIFLLCRHLRYCVTGGKGNTMAVIMVLLGVLLFRTQFVMGRPNRTTAEGLTEIFTVS